MYKEWIQVTISSCMLQFTANHLACIARLWGLRFRSLNAYMLNLEVPPDLGAIWSCSPAHVRHLIVHSGNHPIPLEITIDNVARCSSSRETCLAILPNCKSQVEVPQLTSYRHFHFVKWILQDIICVKLIDVPQQVVHAGCPWLCGHKNLCTC